MKTTKETLNIQIQNRLVEQLTERNRELKLVNSFTQHLQNSMTTTDVIRLLKENFKTYYNHDHCEIYLMDDNKETFKKIIPQQNVSNDFKSLGNNMDQCCGEVLVKKAAKSGKAKIRSTLDENICKEDKQILFRSEIAIPMLHNGKDIVGVIYSRHHNSDFFQHNQLKTMITLSSIAATKILETENLAKINEYQTQLEEYVHIVSHDLKSPLRSINALVAWIKEDNLEKLDDQSLQNIDLIDSTLLQMDNLITNALNYSRMDYDVFEEEDVDLNVIIKDIANTLYMEDHISFCVPDQLPTVKGNRTKFMQIFQNLIENAVKYIDKPKGEVSIGFFYNPEFYTFSIKDNGVGIKKAYFEKIFQVFQTLNDKKDSSGVGLSIVKKLVTNYGGKIWLESQEGLGSTFYFTLKRY